MPNNTRGVRCVYIICYYVVVVVIIDVNVLHIELILLFLPSMLARPQFDAVRYYAVVPCMVVVSQFQNRVTNNQFVRTLMACCVIVVRLVDTTQEYMTRRRFTYDNNRHASECRAVEKSLRNVG